MMKTRHNNDLTDSMSAIYVENYIELLRLIGSDEIYDKN